MHTSLFLNHPFNESLQRPLLEELEVGGWYHCQITKVHIVHLHLSGGDHLMDHHPVEPHSVRRHAADLTPSNKSLGKAIALRHLRTGVASSRRREEEKEKDGTDQSRHG